AIKFTPAGGHIEVRLSCAKGCAAITVSDTGQGISPEFLPHVFERFRQERRNANGSGGLGLGLAIARYLVERHRGKISALSPGAGQGSTFKISLPLAHEARAGTLSSETWTTSV